MQDFLNSPEVKIWKMFLRAHAMLMRKAEKALQEQTGVSLTRLDILVQLSLAERQRMTHTRLAERVLITGGGLTRLVDRMAKEGLVVRRASRKDRRASNVVLTDKGRTVMDEALPVNAEVVKEGFIEHLREEEIPVLRNTLARILDEETDDRVRGTEESK